MPCGAGWAGVADAGLCALSGDRLRQGHLYGGDRRRPSRPALCGGGTGGGLSAAGHGKGDAAELHNVVFVCDDAAQLGDMFAPGEVDRIYINFCDPWPSKSTPSGG